MIVSRARYSNSPPDTLLLINPATWCGDLRLEVELTVSQVINGRSSTEWGPVFHYVDANNYYALAIYWNGNTELVGLRRVVNGVTQSPLTFFSLPFVPLSQVKQRLYVTSRGNQITIGWSDTSADHPLATVNTGGHLPAGYSGMRAFIVGGGTPSTYLWMYYNRFTQRPVP